MTMKTIDEKEAILQAIATNKVAVARSIKAIYQYQTTSEQSSKSTSEENGMGFNAFDAEFLSSLAQSYNANGGLTERQVEAGRKKIVRYIRQLEGVGFENLFLGIEDESWEKMERKREIIKEEKKIYFEKREYVKNNPYMKLNGDRYEFFGSYDNKDIPKDAGFRWDKKNKVWYTNSDDNALKLIEYAREDAKAKLEAFQIKSKESLEESYASSADIKVPSPEGLTYLPYQLAGIDYAMKRDKTLIADEMGLGKTIQAIGVANMLEAKTLTIICHASIKLNWKRELEKWLTYDINIEILSGRKNLEVEKASAGIRIINYDVLDAWTELLADTELLIVDESQYVKNNKSKRTKAVAKLSKKATKVLLLTGTPVLNRPVELWSQLSMLGNPLGDSWFHFVKNYCNARQTQFGWDVSGSKNVGELGQKLRQTVMVRREKKEVLKELPDKRRQVIEVSGSKYNKFIKAEKDADSGYQNKKRDLKNKIKQADSEGREAYENDVNELRELEINHISEMAILRHETALAKVPDLIEHVNILLEQTDKIIVFVHHRDVMGLLKKEYSGQCVSIMGGDKIEERQAVIDKFQTDPKIRVFLGSIKAAGTGITLTAASTVVFGELDWTPATISQCEDRAHRMGQKNMVLIHHLVVNDSIDAKMAKMLVRKQTMINKING